MKKVNSLPDPMAVIGHELPHKKSRTAMNILFDEENDEISDCGNLSDPSDEVTQYLAGSRVETRALKPLHSITHIGLTSKMTISTIFVSLCDRPHLCDWPCEKGAYALILILRKTSIFTSLHKCIEFHIFV